MVTNPIQGRRHAVAVGATFGHLEVVEELTGRDRNGSRRWRCRCLRVRGGRLCGNLTVKATPQLTSDRFRACKECSEANLREQRLAYSRGIFTGGKGR
jgi:hypothetical protein